MLLLWSLATPALLRHTSGPPQVSLTDLSTRLAQAPSPDSRAAALLALLLHSQGPEPAARHPSPVDMERRRMSRPHMLLLRAYLEEERVAGAALVYTGILQMACRIGHWQGLVLLLNHVPGWSEMALLEALATACERGAVRCLRALLPHLDPSLLCAPLDALNLAVQGANPAAVRLLLRDGRLNLPQVGLGALLSAVRHSCPSILRILLARPGIDALGGDEGQLLLEQAFVTMHCKTLAVLLRDPRLNVSFDGNALFVQCIETGRVDIARMLLVHPRFDPTLEDYALLGRLGGGIASTRHLMLLGLLLAHPRVQLDGLHDPALRRLVTLLRTAPERLADVEDPVLIDTLINRAACHGDTRLALALSTALDDGLRSPAQQCQTLALAAALHQHSTVAALLQALPLRAVSARFADILIRRAARDRHWPALRAYWEMLTMAGAGQGRTSPLAALIRVARRLEADPPEKARLILGLWAAEMDRQIEKLPRHQPMVRRLFRIATQHYTLTVTRGLDYGLPIVSDLSDYILLLAWTV